MTADSTALRELAERLRVADGLSRELFDAVAAALGVPRRHRARRMIGIGAWLDACAALQAERLPGWKWSIQRGDSGPYAEVWCSNDDVLFTSHGRPGATPELAWLSAIVTAELAKTEEG